MWLIQRHLVGGKFAGERVMLQSYRTFNAIQSLKRRSSERQKEMLNCLKENGKMTTTELRKKLGWTTNLINSIFVGLKKQDKVWSDYKIENGHSVKEIWLTELQEKMKVEK